MVGGLICILSSRGLTLRNREENKGKIRKSEKNGIKKENGAGKKERSGKKEERRKKEEKKKEKETEKK